MNAIQDVLIQCEASDPDLLDIFNRGYCSTVLVRFHNRKCYTIEFIEPGRLAQELASEVIQRRGIRADPDMVIIPEITQKEMLTAIMQLESIKYFDRRIPMDWVESTADDLVVTLQKTA